MRKIWNGAMKFGIRERATFGQRHQQFQSGQRKTRVEALARGP
jgi:hypothetical protein